MENVTYEAYRRNPALREQLEREAGRERHREMERLIVAPLVRCVKRAFASAQPKSAPVHKQSASFQA